MLEFLKNHQNYLDFFNEYNKLLFLIKKIFFPQHIMMERYSLEEKNIIKDIRSIFKDKIENLEI